MISRMKEAIVGGSNFYYITKDKKYFIKVCIGSEEWLTKEFLILKKYWNNLGVENFQLVEPVKYSKSKEFIATKFVDGKRLASILDPKIYKDFGKKLKTFHIKGFAHSHLELQDVIFENGRYYLSDVPFFGEWPQLHDLVTIKMSFNMHKLKKPWNWYKYKICCREFFKGYELEDLTDFQRDYNYSFNVRMNLLLKNGFLNKLKRIILKFVKRIGLL